MTKRVREKAKEVKEALNTPVPENLIIKAQKKAHKQGSAVDPELTIKELRFCQHYVANGGNATKAYQAAGYSGTEASGAVRACKLLKKDKIVHKIKYLEQEALAAAQVTAEWKIKMLKQMAERCISGDGLNFECANPSGLVACVAELNKMQGHHAVQKTMSHNIVGVTESLEEVNSIISQFEKEF